MGKKLGLGLLIGVTIFGLTGCTKKITEPFTITCEGKDDLMLGVETTNKSIYHFGKDQYTTDYEVTTISIYEDEEAYKTYKESSEETAKNAQTPIITYNVSSDDNTKTVNFSYKVTLSSEDLNALADKDYYKASEVLKRAETNPNAKCTIDGAERNQFK